LWKEYFNYPKSSNLDRNISEVEIEMMKRKMDELIDAKDNNNIELNSSQDAEFLVRKSYLGKTDLCFCGSGKKVIDCCIPEEKFNEISKKSRNVNKGK
jgi:uncharacterized protein YecA (UPF0149 family)